MATNRTRLESIPGLNVDVGVLQECHDASDWNNDILISLSWSSPCHRGIPLTYSLA